jgi:hypothetical protein
MRVAAVGSRKFSAASLLVVVLGEHAPSAIITRGRADPAQRPDCRCMRNGDRVLGWEKARHQVHDRQSQENGESRSLRCLLTNSR